MEKIRDNIWAITFTELGKPVERGFYAVPGLEGELLIDTADMRYIEEAHSLGVEPMFFISRSRALQGDFIVVARRQTDKNAYLGVEAGLEVPA